MIKRELLLERDFLIFDGWDALSGKGEFINVTFRRNAAEGITLRVYGTIGTSDLTGEKTIEDMEVKLGDIDITDGLSDKFLQNLVHEAVEENT